MSFNYCIWLSCHETHGNTTGIPNELSTKYNLTNICLVRVWIASAFDFFFLRSQFSHDYSLFSAYCVLFMGPTSTLLKKYFKIGSHSTIHTFKNYFTTVFSVFNKISDI